MTSLSWFQVEVLEVLSQVDIPLSALKLFELGDYPSTWSYRKLAMKISGCMNHSLIKIHRKTLDRPHKLYEITLYGRQRLEGVRTHKFFSKSQVKVSKL